MEPFKGVLQGNVRTLEWREPPHDFGTQGSPQKKLILYTNGEGNGHKGPQPILAYQQKLLEEFFGEDYKFLVLNGVSHIQGIS